MRKIARSASVVVLVLALVFGGAGVTGAAGGAATVAGAGPVLGAGSAAAPGGGPGAATDVAATVAGAGIAPTGAAADSPAYSLGLLPADPEVVAARLDQARLSRLSELARASLPASVDWTSFLPAPGNQGFEASCTGWAVAYALKTQEEQVERAWGLDTTDHIFSPAFLYNQRPGYAFGDRGAYFADILDIAVADGCTTLTSPDGDGMPYVPGDWATQPNEAQHARAESFRVDHWTPIADPDPSVEVALMKAALNSWPILTGVLVYHTGGWEPPSSWSVPAGYTVGEIRNSWVNGGPGDYRGGHAICLIGYDDTRDMGADGLGAFKFINSWGPSWGTFGGYGWLSYTYYKQRNTDDCSYEVYDQTVTLSLDDAFLTLHDGETHQLEATAHYTYPGNPRAGTDENVTHLARTTWVTSDPAVVSVDSGFLTAGEPGTATVSVSHDYVTCSCKVEVELGFSAPSSLTAWTTPEGIGLDWLPGTGHLAAQGYEIYLAREPGSSYEYAAAATSPPARLDVTVFPGLMGGRLYWLKVRAYADVEGEGRVYSPFTAPVSATAGPLPPAAPTNLRAMTIEGSAGAGGEGGEEGTPGGVRLTWRAPRTPIGAPAGASAGAPAPTSYLIEISRTSGGEYTVVKEVSDWPGKDDPVPAQPCCDVTFADFDSEDDPAWGFDFEAGARYYFRVWSAYDHPLDRDVRVLSPTPAKVAAAAGPRRRPAPPVSVQAVPYEGDSGFRLAWRSPRHRTGVPDPTLYQVGVARTSQGPFTVVAMTADFSLDVTRDVLEGAGLPYVPGARYYAAISSGFSPWPGEAPVLSSQPARVSVTAWPTAPAAPKSLRAVAAPTGDGLVLTWRAPSPSNRYPAPTFYVVEASWQVARPAGHSAARAGSVPLVWTEPARVATVTWDPAAAPGVLAYSVTAADLAAAVPGYSPAPGERLRLLVRSAYPHPVYPDLTVLSLSAAAVYARWPLP